MANYIAVSKDRLAALTSLRDLVEHLPAYGLTASTISVNVDELKMMISGKIPAGQEEHLGVKEVV